MNEPNLLVLSAMAFLAVFLLLSLLAFLMYLLTILFPERSDEGPDPALLAAVSSAAAAAFPGMKVTHIQETR
jgi:hypothetical protein